MKSEIKSFRNLIVWQKSADLAVLVYRYTEKFPRSEQNGLVNQMRRAVVSVSSNIAEGFKRNHKKEKVQFYAVSYGSVSELESQIEISKRLNYLNEKQSSELLNLVIEISKMTDSLIRSTNNNFSRSYVLNSIFFLFFLYSVFYILNPSSALAARFSVETPKDTGMEQFVAKIYLDTEGVSINAIEGSIALLKSAKVQIRADNSDVPFWVDQPILNASKRTISFSGIIPNGYPGNRAFLFSIVFSDGNAFSGTRFSGTAYKNDGLGTKLAIEENRTSIIRLASVSLPDISDDREPPETFTPLLGNDPANPDIYAVFFATQDKFSGIDHYEVAEARPTLFGLAPKVLTFEKAVSPYNLSDQDKASFIYVKAVDRNGNERVEKISPENRFLAYRFALFLGIILLLLIGAIGYVGKKFRRGK